VSPGQTGTSPTGTEIFELSGDVQFDAGADIRSTLDLETDGTGVWPSHRDDLFAPYGNEIFVERGVRYGNGQTEWVSLGYFRIYTTEQESPPDGPLRIAGKDRMSGIIDGRLLNPVQFIATKTRGDVVAQLVQDVYPGAVIEWDDSAQLVQIGKALVADEDRYGFLNDLITAAGKVWYWDYRGILVIKTPPDPGNPVFDVDHGHNGVLVSMSRDLTREGVYNGVAATGEASDTTAPARAVVVDNNPNSPTYWYGQFGKVPRFYSSPFISTPAQALNAAGALLVQSLGLPYGLNFGSIVNAALEPLDPVRVVYPPRARSGGDVSEVHVIERLTIPLAVDAALSATTREQTSITLGELI
jgi:hypothetical protein